MEQWKGKVAAVTGASAGIGAAITIDLIKSGMTVVGLARRKDKILALKSQLPIELQNQLYAIECDVQLESDIKSAFEWIKNNLNSLDVLINNAGIIRSDYILDKNNANNLRNVMDTNVLGVALCTREAFHIMKENDDRYGHIIMLNSIAGHKVVIQRSMPTFNLYYSSKFALTAMTEVLRQELAIFETKIRISSVSPAFVKSEILGDQMKLPDNIPLIDATDVSAGVLYILGTPPHVEIEDLIMKPSRMRS